MLAPLLTPGRIAAAGFTLAYTLLAALAAVLTGNGEFVFYVIVMAILIAAVAAIHVRVRFTTALLWCLAVWGLLHMAGGLVPVPESWPINGETRVLYSWWIVPIGDPGSGTGGEGVGQGGWLKYDHLVHAFGFGTTTWACWQALAHTVASVTRPTFGLLTLCSTAALGFGALNEVVEFIATLLGPSNVGGYVNTGWDLIANTLGVLLAAMLLRLFARRETSL